MAKIILQWPIHLCHYAQQDKSYLSCYESLSVGMLEEKDICGQCTRYKDLGCEEKMSRWSGKVISMHPKGSLQHWWQWSGLTSKTTKKGNPYPRGTPVIHVVTKCKFTTWKTKNRNIVHSSIVNLQVKLECLKNKNTKLQKMVEEKDELLSTKLAQDLSSSNRKVHKNGQSVCCFEPFSMDICLIW